MVANIADKDTVNTLSQKLSKLVDQVNTQDQEMTKLQDQLNTVLGKLKTTTTTTA